MNGIVAIILVASLVSFGSTKPSLKSNSLHNLEKKQVEEWLTEEPIKIGAFNIQVFGGAKYGKPEVVANILHIFARYDMICVQEIRESANTSFPALVQQFNESTTDAYNYVLADSVGRSTSKEQYACIYKTSRLQVMSWKTYNDSSDIFEWEPLVMKIHTLVPNAISDFGLILIHTKPSDAVNEINGLVKVYDESAADYGIQDFIILGDFNADCSYVSSTKWCNVTLRTQDRFWWIIGDEVDTTVSSTHCAYDRIVVIGEAINKAYIPHTANIFNYEQELGLTNEQAKDVSDHFPVEMFLYGGETPDSDVRHPEVCLSVPCTLPTRGQPNPLDLLHNCTTGSSTCAPGFETANITVNQKPSFIVVNASSAINCNDVLDKLNAFLQHQPNMMSNLTVLDVATVLNTGSVLPNLPPIPQHPQWANPKCKLEIKYLITDPLTCDVIIRKSEG